MMHAGETASKVVIYAERASQTRNVIITEIQFNSVLVH